MTIVTSIFTFTNVAVPILVNSVAEPPRFWAAPDGLGSGADSGSDLLAYLRNAARAALKKCGSGSQLQPTKKSAPVQEPA